MAYINPYQQAMQGRAKQTKRKKPKVGASYQNYMHQANNPKFTSSSSVTGELKRKNINKKGEVGSGSGGIRLADDSTDNKVMGALAGGFSLGGGDSGSMFPNNNAQGIVTTSAPVGSVNNQSSPTSGASATSSMQRGGVGEQTLNAQEAMRLAQ